MSLLNNGSTDYIASNGTVTDSPSAITVAAWVRLSAYHASDFAYMAFFTPFRSFNFSYPNNDEVELGVARSGGSSNSITTDLNAALDTWYFIAGVFNEDDTVWGGSNAIEIASGTVSSEITQRTSSVQLAGSGTTTALSSSTVYLTNRDTSDTRRVSGDIAFFTYFESELSLEQLRSFQYDPFQALLYSPRVLLFPGLMSVSAVPDWSGNGLHYTAANMTLSSSPPLPLFALKQTWTLAGPAATPDSDSQSGYIEGLTYFPFTEDFTGQSDLAEWRRSHWVPSVA